MNEIHFTPRPSEEAALDRAITSIDPLLQASLQRDQKRRRRKIAIAGGILMAVCIATLVTGFIFLGGGLFGGAADEVDRLEKAADIAADGFKLWQQKKLDQAEVKFKNSLKVDPQQINAWNGLGWCQLNQGKLNEASDSFTKCVELSANHPAALNGLGQINLALGKYDKAEEYLLKAESASAAWYGLVRLYLLKGEFDKAQPFVKKLDKATGVDENELKQFQAAIDAKKLDDKLRSRLEPVALAADGDVAELSQRGWRLFQSGKNRPATAAFEAALKKDPSYASAINGLAFAYLNQGLSDKAQPLFEKLLNEQPKHFGAMNGLARCYKNAGKTDKAIEIWTKMEVQLPSVSAATTG
ncbi:MAG: tetratricopeptide (TPR) repeat protein, partial [Pirellulaceae bacterium]